MARRFFGGRKIRGLSTDTKPTAPEDDAEFYETNTKKTFDWSGSAWVERITGVGSTVEHTELAGNIPLSKLANGTAGKIIGFNASTGAIEEQDAPAGGADANTVVMPHDQTIGNYTIFSTVDASSEGTGASQTTVMGTVPSNNGLGNSGNTPQLVMTRNIDGGNAHDVTNLSISYTVYANNNGWRYHQLDMVTSSGTTTVVPYQQVGDWATTTYNYSNASVSGFIGFKMYGRSYYGTDYATVTQCQADYAPIQEKGNLVNGNTSTLWLSTQETNPWCTVETSSSSLCDHVAIYPTSDNTETEIQVQTKTQTFGDNFSSDNWTDTSFTGVSGGVLTGDLIRNSTNHGAERAITAVSDTKWVMRFKLIINTKATAENNSVALALSDQGLVGINPNKDGIGVGISQFHNAFALLTPDNSYWFNATYSSTANPDVGTYYIELIRDSATSATMKIYSDEYSTLTETVTNSSISSGITGLDNLVVQGMNDSGTGGTWNISIDNIEIYDGVNTAPDWVTQRTITTSNLTNGQYNYVRFNPVNCNKVRIRGSSGSSKVLAISEIKVKEGITESDIITQHGHKTISSTDTTTGLDGT